MKNAPQKETEVCFKSRPTIGSKTNQVILLSQLLIQVNKPK